MKLCNTYQVCKSRIKFLYSKGYLLIDENHEVYISKAGTNTLLNSTKLKVLKP